MTKLRTRIKNFLRVGHDPSIDRLHTVKTYLKAAARLEEKVSGWCDIPSWLPQKVVLDTSQRPQHRTPWTSGTLFRLHYYQSWAGFFHWNRHFVAKICLHEALLNALAHISGTSSSSSRDNDFEGMSDLVASHTAIIHETVGDFLGTLAYAFGDVDEDGHVRSIPTPVVSDGTATEHRGINVPATLQIQPPLAHLITSRYLGAGQREAMLLALQRVRAEFSLR